MAIWHNDTENTGGVTSLYPPTVNVSLTGTMPVQPQTFKLSLPCTGKVSVEVEVILNINVTSPRPRQPPTVLYFKRKKICLVGKFSLQYFLSCIDLYHDLIYLLVLLFFGINIMNFLIILGQSAEGFAPHQDPLEGDGEKENLQLVYYITPALAGGTLVVMIIVGIACFRRRGKGVQTQDHSILT